ncbi:MAG: c-type cytochrome domain-containing protein [Verrucomicrobiota bacterium]
MRDTSLALKLSLAAQFLVLTQFQIPCSAADDSVSFKKQIAPILVQKCSTCHNPEKAKGKYLVQTFESLMKTGSSGDAPIVPGKPEQSHLFRLITTKDEDDRMPQKSDPLPAEQVALVERWIRLGALFDGEDPRIELARLIPDLPHPAAPENYPRPVPVLALAFHPKGGELAASGYHEVTIWNLESGRLDRRLGNLPQRIHSLIWHPDGSRIVVAGGSPGIAGEVTIVDVNAHTVIRKLGRFPDVALCLALSPDGGKLAVGGADNSIHLYDLNTGDELLVIQQHADWVTGVAFNTDGSQLASVSRDKTARICLTQNGALETTFAGHEAALFGVAFSADGKTVFSCGRDKKIIAWKSDDGKKSGETAGFEGEIFALTREADHLFTAASDMHVRQHTAGDRKLVRTFSGHADWVYALAVHAETRRLASGAYDGEIRLWNFENGELVRRWIAAPNLAAPSTSTAASAR